MLKEFLYHRANVPAKQAFLWVFTREKSQKSTKENLRPWKTTHPLVDLGFSKNNMPPGAEHQARPLSS